MRQFPSKLFDEEFLSRKAQSDKYEIGFLRNDFGNYRLDTFVGLIETEGWRLSSSDAQRREPLDERRGSHFRYTIGATK